MKKLLLILFAFTSHWVHAQVIVTTGTDIAQANTPDIVVRASGDLINNSSFDFSETNLRIHLNGPVTAITGNWYIKQFKLAADTGSVIDLQGNFTVTEGLELVSGIIRFQSGKILYNGESANLTVDKEGNSYVNGPFFQSGDGNRQFPVGTANGYAPVRFPAVKSKIEIGVQAFDDDPQLVPDNVEVLAVNSGRYWRITSSELAQINSNVNLSTRGMLISGQGSPTIVQATALGSAAANLKTSSVNEDNITSLLAVTAPILAIGNQEEIIVKIHDLITPFTVTQNDKLFIENIERFTIRKVTFLDRYGKVIKEWGNEFTNDIDYDFTQLSPGNYICVAEYGNEGSGTTKISQMVTVLKTNVANKN